MGGALLGRAFPSQAGQSRGGTVPPQGRQHRGGSRPASPELGVAVLAAEAGVVEDGFIRHQPLHGVDGFLAGGAHLLHLRLQAEGLGRGRPKGERMRKGLG